MLSVVAFVVALGFGIVAPAIPLFARSFGVGTTAVGLAVSAFAFFRFVSAFGGGSLVERLGERVVLTLGLVTVAVTTGAAGLAGNFPLFLGLRAAGGVGSAMFTVAALSLLLRVSPPSHRGRAAATYQGGFILGGIAGPAAGGLLAELSPRLPFLLYAGFLLVAGGVSLLFLRSPAAPGLAAAPAAAPEPDAGPLPLRAAFRSRVYLAALVVNLGVGWMLFGVRNSLVPLYVTEELGRTVTWAGLGLLAGSLAQAVGLLRSGRLADAWGRRPSLVLGTALATGATAVLVLPPATWAFLLSMSVFGLAASLLSSVPAALVGDISPARGGRVVAVFQMSADLGGIVGPLAAGWLTDAAGFQVAFGVTTAVLGLGLVAALALPRSAGARPAPSGVAQSPAGTAR
ncbi:MFS transporter [Geodermatophilus sabuli]|uniref:Predicted arabinose efflux permease, MFS family n=1 Tax=Geodermatophilus sabuli TaxID=1564158 RepID=A0A285EK12_9ACTN|nr:MFS transporter [Geodermatophilus sabuli]MBB3083765.1 MFS family permease [Geodermatophilus sabuli]SNX99193.1 Predicted arabinose efflux permease, MFS family [Geodermatophilus sabuli]